MPTRGRGGTQTAVLTVALLGRPNVGKSTLANRLSGKWDALVSPVPGFTRDRRDVDVEWRGRALRLIDMGGWVEINDPRETLAPAVRRQILQGLGQANLVLLVMDVRDGLMAADRTLADLARRSGRPCVIAVNAVDNAEMESSAAEFAALGFQHVIPVSALHGRNSDELLDAILDATVARPSGRDDSRAEAQATTYPRIAIVGRPNSGKSSLVNALLGEDRMVVDAAPGTTRDPIDSRWGPFTLVDTAGIRRAGMKGAPPSAGSLDLLRAEHLCVMMAERAIERADAALLLVDAAAGWSDVDARIGGLIREAGAACGILYTKWDLIHEKTRTAGALEQERRSRVQFLDWAPSLAVSATASVHLDEVPSLCAKVVGSRAAQLDLRRLEETLMASLDRRPIVQHGHPVEIEGVRQTGTCPPEITVILKRRGGGAGKARPGRPARGPSLHFSHIRFLERAIRQVFDLAGTPLRVRIGDRL